MPTLELFADNWQRVAFLCLRPSASAAAFKALQACVATTMVDVFAIPAVVGPIAGVVYTLLMTLAVIPTVGGDGTLGFEGFSRCVSAPPPVPAAITWVTVFAHCAACDPDDFLVTQVAAGVNSCRVRHFPLPSPTTISWFCHNLPPHAATLPRLRCRRSTGDSGLSTRPSAW